MICLKGAMRIFQPAYQYQYLSSNSVRPRSRKYPCLFSQLSGATTFLAYFSSSRGGLDSCSGLKKIWLHLIFLSFRCWNGWNLPWIYKESHWIWGSNPNPKSVKGTDGGFHLQLQEQPSGLMNVVAEYLAGDTTAIFRSSFWGDAATSGAIFGETFGMSIWQNIWQNIDDCTI